MNTLKYLFLLLVWAAAPGVALSQTHREKSSQELSFDPEKGLNVLRIANIDGCVRVVPYAGKKVIFEVERIIEAASDLGLRQAKAELELGFRVSDDSIISFLKAPLLNPPCPDRAQNPQPNFNKSRKYTITHNLTIKVPTDTNPAFITEQNGNLKQRGGPAKQTKPTRVIGPVLLDNIVA